MYQLQKYRTRATRHECPKCHDRHSFTYYVDEDGQPLDPTCGKCDHKSKCGYHYPPREYFRDHPTDKPTTRNFIPKMQMKPLCTMPEGIVTRYASYNSIFVEFLRGLFPQKLVIPRLGSLYGLGATKDKDVIFWQIDVNGRVRGGKIIKFYPKGHPRFGHRDKECQYPVTWLHSKIKMPNDWVLTQCLFGEHLLNLSMNKNKTVALVESEKSALIGAACFPQYVWLASGGMSQLSVDKMKVLAGRTVIMFPDVDGFKEWTEKAKEFSFCKDVIVSDALEKNASDDQRAAKIDIADVLVDKLRSGDYPIPEPTEEYHWLFYQWMTAKPKSDLELMIEERPHIQHMIDELGLVPED